MLVRKFVLIITGIAGLSLATGCGPSFKAGHDKKSGSTSAPAPAATPQTPTDGGATTPDLEAQGEGVSGDLATGPGVRLIPLSTADIVDKFVVGITLEKGDKKNNLFVIMKDKDTDAGPNVELNSPLSTEIADNSREFVPVEKIQLNNISDQDFEIKKEEYSVSYRCFEACAKVEVSVQRITGETVDAEGKKTLVGFHSTFNFEVNGTEKKLVLKQSNTTQVKSADEARLLVVATPVVSALPGAPAPAGAAPIAGAPAPIAKTAAQLRSELIARIKAVPHKPLVRPLPCDKTTKAYRDAVAAFEVEARANRVSELRAAGLTITDAQAKDKTLLPFGTPVSSGKCEPVKKVTTAADTSGNRAGALLRAQERAVAAGVTSSGRSWSAPAQAGKANRPVAGSASTAVRPTAAAVISRPAGAPMSAIHTQGSD